MIVPCDLCGASLSQDEVGLSRKLLGRGNDDCLCLKCLGKKFKVSEGQLREMIERYRKSGCTLFPPLKN